MDNRISVGVLRGGKSSEYYISLNTGASVLSSLDQSKYKPVDIFIDKSGTFHFSGIPIEIQELSNKVDVLFNALHGTFGENGELQSLLNNLGIPYTGSGVIGGSLGANKVQSKNILSDLPFKIPKHIFVKKGEDIEERALDIWRNFSQPTVVKPINHGSSIGVTLARSFFDLVNGLSNALLYDDIVMVEEYISGREVSVGVIDGYRGREHYTLFPVEIRKKKDGIYDYESKLNGGLEHISPASFSVKEKNDLQDLALLVHKKMGLKSYSNTDFIISPKRGIYFLEVNPLSKLSEHSMMNKALNSVASPFSHFLDHVISMTLGH